MAWQDIQGALTAPKGYKWQNNGKSRFSKEYKHRLIKEDKIMTREDKLYSMTMANLQIVADKLGIKINSKAAKSKAIEKILEAEAQQEWEESQKKDTSEADKIAEDNFNKAHKTSAEAPMKPIQEPKTAEPKETPKKNVKTPKRTNLKLKELTYKGETKPIKEWAAEINMPWPTLYDRINRNGWSVEEAIETPLGQKRSK